ncbi:MAG: hypothetical protein M1831_004890 [Alyxoria varia]|nr:MAG: hypothetical protein M1831_004890 [Alyxoria varia]
MLSHLSTKFSYQPKADAHEPRAALFVNRYTRTLTIMYATNGLADILGLSGEEMRGRSFYYCIQENCLPDAVRCLENAKQNDSIAYLRFWFRDPRQDENSDQLQGNTNGSSERMDIDDSSSGLRSDTEDSEMGGVQLNGHGHQQNTRMPGISENAAESQAVSSSSSVEPTESAPQRPQVPEPRGSAMSSSGNESTPFTHEAVFGEPPPQYSSASSASGSPYEEQRANGRWTGRRTDPIELEAVVSCTSDGLVVCLRRAHPALEMAPINRPSRPMYQNGLFAVPWSPDPVLPPLSQRPQYVQHSESVGGLSAQPRPQAVQHSMAQPTQPSNTDFMNSIRQLSVFAWALNGINGSMNDFSRGTPRGEAQPPAGLPIWQPEADQKANYEAAGTHTGHLADELSTSYNGSNKIIPAPALGTGGIAANATQPPNFSMPFSSNDAGPTNGNSRSRPPP